MPVQRWQAVYRRMWPLPLVMLAWAALAPPAAAQGTDPASEGPRFLVVAMAGAPPVETRDAPVLRRRITADLSGVTLGDALRAVGDQSHVRFALSRETLPVDRRVSLHASGITLGAALYELLAGLGLDVQFSRDGASAAIVRRADPVGMAEATGGIVGRVTDEKTGAGLVGATVAVDGTRLVAVAGGDGKYRIAEVPVGPHTVRARYIGYGPATAAVTVVADADAVADLALTKSVQRLDEVVTTGTVVPTEVRALPTPVTVISAEQIEGLHPQRFDELLTFAVPGAIAGNTDRGTQNPTGQLLTLRGLRSAFVAGNSDNPKMYIDGIETADRDNLSIDPQSIERIEIIRGPQAAAIYGSDAMGGVIQVFTKRGTAGRTRPEIELGAALGRIESDFTGYTGALRQEYTAALTGRLRDASYRFGGGYRKTGEWVPLFAESTPSFQGSLRIEPGPVVLELSARVEQSRFGAGFSPVLLETGYAPYGTLPDYRHTSSGFGTYALHAGYRPTSWWSHSLTVGIDRYTTSSVRDRPTRSTPDDTLLSLFETERQKVSIAYNTAATLPLGAGMTATLIAGADHYKDPYTDFYTGGALSTDPLRLAPDWNIYGDRYSTTNTGIFAQAQLGWRDRIFLTAAARAEDNSDFGQELSWPISPRVGATVVQAFGEVTVKVRASYGRAIRPPLPGQRDSIPGDFFVQLPNPGLRSARQSGPDGGVDLIFGRRGSLSVTYFHQITKDFLYSISDYTKLPFISQYVNIGRVRNDGWEFEGTLDLAYVTLRGNYAITHSVPEDLGPVGEFPPIYVLNQQFGYWPERTAGLILTATPMRRTSVTAGLAYTAGANADASSAEIYRCLGGTGPCRSDPIDYSGYYDKGPSYLKVNASVYQQLGGAVSAYLSVDDLTNQDLRRARRDLSAAPGRITTLGFRVRY